VRRGRQKRGESVRTGHQPRILIVADISALDHETAKLLSKREARDAEAIERDRAVTRFFYPPWP
jgi:hypothetical protein